jgi:hypothetical protein
MRMEKMRVLVANEMCAYREVIAEVFQELRPHVEVHCVEPDDLDHEIACHRPHLVVCSQLTDAMHSLLAWIMLYPDGENRAVVSTAGEHTTLANVGFDHLLSIIDKTELLYQSPRMAEGDL